MKLNMPDKVEILRRRYEMLYMSIDNFDDLEKHTEELDSIYLELKKAQAEVH